MPTLPPDFAGTSHCAHIRVHPSGRFLYGSNRGHDSVVAYQIDTFTDQLTYVGHFPTMGRTPRNFALDPTGSLLLAANQNDDSIVVFRVDQSTGSLQPINQVTGIPRPVCIVLLPVQ